MLFSTRINFCIPIFSILKYQSNWIIINSKLAFSLDAVEKHTFFSIIYHRRIQLRVVPSSLVKKGHSWHNLYETTNEIVSYLPFPNLLFHCSRVLTGSSRLRIGFGSASALACSSHCIRFNGKECVINR